MQTMKSSSVGILALALVSLLCTACTMRARLAVAPGSSASGITFTLSEWDGSRPGELIGVAVHRCLPGKRSFPERGERVWYASVESSAEGPLVGTFEYGQETGELKSVGSPVTLGVGCYIANAYARFPDTRGAVLVFDILADGSVVGRPDT
jgi:hypothetical protein